MTGYTCLILPFPPSVNSIIACWKVGGKCARIKTAKHKDYMAEATKAIRKQPRETYDQTVMVTASFGVPDRRTRDLDNHFKAVGDAMVVAGVLADDSLIHRLTLQWVPDVVGVRVEIEPFTPPAEA